MFYILKIIANDIYYILNIIVKPLLRDNFFLFLKRKNACVHFSVPVNNSFRIRQIEHVEMLVERVRILSGVYHFIHSLIGDIGAFFFKYIC